MKENETLKINPLPSKTWYWLHLNDTTVKWNGNVQPCLVTTEEPDLTITPAIKQYLKDVTKTL